MCLCNKINKIYSAKGLYHGRPIPYMTKLSDPKVMVKKTTTSSAVKK